MAAAVLDRCPFGSAEPVSREFYKKQRSQGLGTLPGLDTLGRRCEHKRWHQHVEVATCENWLRMQRLTVAGRYPKPCCEVSANLVSVARAQGHSVKTGRLFESLQPMSSNAVKGAAAHTRGGFICIFERAHSGEIHVPQLNPVAWAASLGRVRRTFSTNPQQGRAARSDADFGYRCGYSSTSNPGGDDFLR